MSRNILYMYMFLLVSCNSQCFKIIPTSFLYYSRILFVNSKRSYQNNYLSFLYDNFLLLYDFIILPISKFNSFLPVHKVQFEVRKMIIKERRGSPTTLSCSTHSKNPKLPVSKHRINMYIDAKEARNTTSHRKTCNKKDYT